MLQSALMELAHDPIFQDAPTCIEMEGPGAVNGCVSGEGRVQRDPVFFAVCPPSSPPPFLYASASAGTLLHRPMLANGVITSTNPDVGIEDNLYADIAMPHLSIS